MKTFSSYFAKYPNERKRKESRSHTSETVTRACEIKKERNNNNNKKKRHTTTATDGDKSVALFFFSFSNVISRGALFFFSFVSLPLSELNMQ